MWLIKMATWSVALLKLYYSAVIFEILLSHCQLMISHRADIRQIGSSMIDRKKSFYLITRSRAGSFVKMSVLSHRVKLQHI